jgi:hypothetical protein
MANTPTYWATQIDYDLAKQSNPNANVKLWTPNAVMQEGDYFLGGEATGITDDMLGGATRIYGADRYATNKAFNQQYMVDAITAAQNKALEAEIEAQRQAQLTAYQRNQQALEAQRQDVGVNYDALVNRLQSLEQSRLPLYQAERDTASAEAAAQLRRTQALNALTGTYHSGSNRSQQLAIDLARQKAIQGATQAESDFRRDITTQLSEAEARRVAALNDIAAQLALNERQYAEGTLSLEKQFASKQAAAAAQSYLDAMEWANMLEQQEIENALRRDQFELEKELGKHSMSYKDRSLAQDDAHFWAALQQEDKHFNTGLKARASSGGGGSSGGGSSGSLNKNQSFAVAMEALESLANGTADGTRWGRSEILNEIINNASYFSSLGVNVKDLYNWASNKYTWDKDKSGKWYNTKE